MRRIITVIHSRRFRRVLLVIFILMCLFEMGLATAIHLYGLTDHVQPAEVIIVLGAGL